MTARLSDRLLLAQVLVVRASGSVRAAMRNAYARLRSDERGQTPTEYLMIVGLMAVVIITAFVFMFWDNIKGAAESWSNNAKESIDGSKIQR